MTHRGRITRLAMIGLVAIFLGPAAAPAGARVSAPPTAPVAGLANFNSNMCLVARGYQDGAPVVQTQCDQRYPDQVWYWVEQTTNWYLLQNKNSGMCMVVRGTDYGARVVQTRCDSRYFDQWWSLMPANGAIFQVLNWNSRQCLVVQGEAEGTQAIQFHCDQNYWDQWWYQITLD